MSGAGTNIGIDYQQRVSSLILLYMYAEYDLNTIFQIGSKLIAQEVFFESNDEIDDLVISCEKSDKCYLQIKKKISFSDKLESDFYSVIRQFVSQFIQSVHSNEYYFLVTSTESSKKIRKDLNKLLEGCRLDNNFNSETLNQSEKDTLEKYKSTVSNIYRSLNNEDISDDQFLALSKKIYITEIDVYNNSTYEKSAFLLLASLNFNDPELIWSLLVKNSLTYASQKLAVDKKRIQEILNNFATKYIVQINEVDELDAAVNNYVIENDFVCGKDVIITDYFLPETKGDYFLIELLRFDDDCEKRLKYNNDTVIFKDGREYKIISRSATVSGALRYIEQNKKMFEDKELCYISGKTVENIENSTCAILQRKKLQAIFNNNNSKRNCLHCENTINDTDSVIVEIDNLFQDANVGIVHLNCLRPIDRVIGTIIIPSKSSKLPNIDLHLWIDLLLKGQGQLNQLRESNMKRPILFIVWVPPIIYDFNYSYCIKCILEDDSTVFVYRRGKIERFDLEEAEEKLRYFQKRMEEANSLNDPWCFTNNHITFGRYSHLLQNKNDDDNILKIKSMSVSKYSALDAKVFNRDIYYYAPLCLPMSRESEEVITLNNIIPLISDPFSYESIVNNWQNLGVSLPVFKWKIIKNDDEFDSLMKVFMRDHLTPIIDPLFDIKGELAKGYIIVDINNLESIQATESFNRNPEM